jgi:hypothetical protein
MFDTTYAVEYNGRTYTVKHGDPFDRGSADSYYDRGRNPHKGGVGGDSSSGAELARMVFILTDSVL